MSRQLHYSTPEKSSIRGTIEYLESRRIPHFKSDVFRFHGARYRSGWRELAEPEDRSFHSAFFETRGRKKKIFDQDLATLERFIENNGFDGRTIPYAGLPAAADLDIDVSEATVRRALKDIDFRLCLAAPEGAAVRVRAGYVRKVPRERRLAAHSFSDECHFGWGPHGKITQQCYRDLILEPVVGSWLREGQYFVLEEDNDSGHGTSKTNIAWQGPEQYVKRRPCWDDDIVRELAEEGWAAVKQDSINDWVDSIPQIFKDCLKLNGAMTGN